MTPEQLQKLFDEALQFGYVDFNKQRYTVAQLEAIAKRRGITLIHNISF